MIGKRQVVISIKLVLFTTVGKYRSLYVFLQVHVAKIDVTASGKWFQYLTTLVYCFFFDEFSWIDGVAWEMITEELEQCGFQVYAASLCKTFLSLL